MRKYSTIWDFIRGTGFMIGVIGLAAVEGVTLFGQSIWPPVLTITAGGMMMYLSERRKH